MANDILNIASANTSSVVLNDKSGQKAAQTHNADVSKIRENAKADESNFSSKKDTNNLANQTKQIDDLQRKDIEKQVQNLQEISQVKGWSVNFSIDNESNKTIIKVVDADTQKTIRQIPSEELLSISKRIQSLREGDDSNSVLSGLLLDRTI
jgi:flagellar protein FlaG